MKAIQTTLLLALGISLPAFAPAAPVHLVDQKPAQIRRLSPDVILVDFDRVAFGNVRLVPPATATNTITVHTAPATAGAGSSGVGKVGGAAASPFTAPFCIAASAAPLTGRHNADLSPQARSLGGRGALFHAAPDLAVEVLSPSDSITKTERRMPIYLSFGSRLALLVDPKNQTVRVYRPGESFELLRGDGFLSGNSVLPGFRVSPAKIFEGV